MNVSNHHIVHLKLAMLYINTISIKLGSVENKKILKFKSLDFHLMT